MIAVVLCSPTPVAEEIVVRCGGVLDAPRVRVDVHDGLHRVVLLGDARPDEATAQVRAHCPGDLAWSVVRTPLLEEGPALFVSDVDSTLITAEVIEEIADAAGTRAQVAAVTERAMRGELDFGDSLRERVATLAGVPESVFAEVAARVSFSPGAGRLVQLARGVGAELALVSGGFHEVVDPLAADLGVTLVRSNRLEVRDGVLTGRTTGPVVDRAAKLVHLREFAEQRGVPLERCVAIGDGANDLAMLQAAGLGIAYRAKPVVTDQTGAVIGFARLDTAFWLSAALLG